MSVNYQEIYNECYFNGKDSFFWRFGYGKLASFYFQNLYQPIAQPLSSLRRGRVLDVGCAFGYLLDKVPDSFEKIGLDISEYALKQGSERVISGKFVLGSAGKQPFTDNTFSAVLLNDVLEHVEDPEEILREVHRIMEAEGLLYITTPNLNWGRKHILGDADRKEHHISMLSHNDLIGLVKRFGFNVTDHWTFINMYFRNIKFHSNFGIESGLIARKK